MNLIIKTVSSEKVNNINNCGELVVDGVIAKANTQTKISFDVMCEEQSGSSYYLKPNCSLYFRNYGNGRARVVVKVINISNEEYVIKAGDRLFQLVRESLVPFRECDISIHIPNSDDYVNDPNLVFIPVLDSGVEFKQFHVGDSGIDLCCPKEVQIGPKRTCMIDLGFYVYSHMNDKIFILPRSSIYKTPLRMANYYKPIIRTPLAMCNAIGLIDGPYRGNIMAIVDNMCDRDYVVNGKHFSLWHPLKKIESVKFSNRLSETTRGSGGFGSTNQK